MKKSIIGMVVLTMVTLSSALVGAQDNKLPAPRINTRPVAPPSDATHWTYEGEKGPQFWGKLAPDFSLCADGQNQSPIDIARTAPAISIGNSERNSVRRTYGSCTTSI